MTSGPLYAALRHAGRRGSYHVTLDVYADPESAALVLLLERDGHRGIGRAAPPGPGRVAVPSPYPGYEMDVDPLELAAMAAQLRAGAPLSTRRDPDDPDYSEEDGWGEAHLIAVSPPMPGLPGAPP